MPDNTIHHSRSQSLESSDRLRRIEGQETQDQPRRPLLRHEITSTPDALEHQSISLPDWLRQQSEQHGVTIFGLSAPEMQGRENQRVDQQASNSRDSHSEPEELRQEPISRQAREEVMELYLQLRDAPPLGHPRRSMSVQDALHRQNLHQSMAESLRNGDYAWEHEFIDKNKHDLGQGR